MRFATYHHADGVLGAAAIVARTKCRDQLARAPGPPPAGVFGSCAAAEPRAAELTPLQAAAELDLGRYGLTNWAAWKRCAGW